jgi:hypothetical protein
MTQSFEDKKALLLSDLRTLALRHNRDYFISLIPFIENAGPEENDIIDMYQAAILDDGAKLAQSRQAFASISQVEDILFSSHI